MEEVHVIGTGIIPFGKYPDKTLADLGWPVAREAILEAGIRVDDIAQGHPPCHRKEKASWGGGNFICG